MIAIVDATSNKLFSDWCLLTPGFCCQPKYYSI